MVAPLAGLQYPGNEYFEVYSPVISTLYGQVFWTVMDPVPLPPAIVKRFAGKTMVRAWPGFDSLCWRFVQPPLSALLS